MYEQMVCTMSHCVVLRPAGSNGTPCIMDEGVSAHGPNGLEGRGINGTVWYVTCLPVTLSPVVTSAF